MATVEQRLASLEQALGALSTPSHAAVMKGIADILTKQTLRDDQMLEWLNGTPTGGPNGDGKYPITDKSGFTRYLESPAKIKFDAAAFGIVDMNGPGPFTVDLTHVGKFLRVGNGSALNGITLRLPNLPRGSNIVVLQTGSGRVTLSANGGSSVIHRQNFGRTAGLNAMATAVVDTVISGASQWKLGGDLSS